MADFEDPDDAVPAAPPPAYEGLSLLDILSRAQRALYATLLERIEAGTAGKEDIKTLRQLLAENGMLLRVNEINQRMIDVSPRPMDLPDFSKGSYDE